MNINSNRHLLLPLLIGGALLLVLVALGISLRSYGSYMTAQVAGPACYRCGPGTVPAGGQCVPAPPPQPPLPPPAPQGQPCYGRVCAPGTICKTCTGPDGQVSRSGCYPPRLPIPCPVSRVPCGNTYCPNNWICRQCQPPGGRSYHDCVPPNWPAVKYCQDVG